MHPYGTRKLFATLAHRQQFLARETILDTFLARGSFVFIVFLFI
jgi:hypothetical protein